MNIKTPKVLVVGDAMLDQYWHGDVDRISPEAPVPVVKVNRQENRLGGAANVALNCSKLGAKTSFMAAVGNDAAAQQIRSLLKINNIHDQLVVGSGTTITKLRIIGRAQQLIRLDFESHACTNAISEQTDSFQEVLSDHDVVIFSDYGKGGLQQIAAMIRMARIASKIVLVDPKGNDYSSYEHANVITPNKSELRQVVGAWQSEEELHRKALNLKDELGLDALLLTRSEEGMTLFDDSGATHFPAQVREVYDVTGAGDTVIATLAVLVANAYTLKDAVPFANKAAGIVVGKFGTSSLTMQELFESN
jgi:D-glycero-beta-D-manno-heptose-7-phosphate kinase